MESNQYRDLPLVVSQFQLEGSLAKVEPYGNGHINDTYQVVMGRNGASQSYILQRINHNVFKKPLEVMENIQRVTKHVQAKISADPELTRKTLTLVPNRNGSSHHCDDHGNCWRIYLFITKARTYETVQTVDQAFEVAKAFGYFQKLVADLPLPQLHETIPDFHNTPKRFAALEKAIQANSANRAHLAKAEIQFAMQRSSLAGVLLDAKLPQRTTHNDTKLNNLLIDEASQKGICVIDLDTVMPGLVGYDFGDLVRTSTSPAKEDERDLSKVQMQFSMFEALIKGYLNSASSFLTKAEKQLLPAAGKLITFENGLRFLTDYLQGDTYYKVHREEHNLDRCRTQFRLVQSIEEQEEQMGRLVERLS